MNRTMRGVIAVVAAVCGCWLALDRGDAGGAKSAWQATLSKEVYQELAKREADLIRELLNGTPEEEAINRAKFGAVLIAGLTMSVKDGVPADDLKGTRERALALAFLLTKKDQLATAKQLAATLPGAKGDLKIKVDVGDWGSYLQKADLMDHFRVKSKGGDGMHADLQSNVRLKGALNGIEEKIRALTMKQLTAAAMKKEAKELELLGYRSAVVGSLTYFYAPVMKKGDKDPQDWRNYSIQMRDASVNLAVAAQKGDAAGVFKASNSLNSACSQCHSVFRNQ
jgi:hypothetical protein